MVHDQYDMQYIIGHAIYHIGLNYDNAYDLYDHHL